MKKHFILAVTLAFAFISGPSLTSAQEVLQDDTLSQAPADENLGQVGATTDYRDDGFNLMWLLPLLAIPIIYMLTRDKKVENSSTYHDHGTMGSKVGKTNSNLDNDRF